MTPRPDWNRIMQRLLRAQRALVTDAPCTQYSAPKLHTPARYGECSNRSRIYHEIWDTAQGSLVYRYRAPGSRLLFAETNRQTELWTLGTASKESIDPSSTYTCARKLCIIYINWRNYIDRVVEERADLSWWRAYVSYFFEDPTMLQLNTITFLEIVGERQLHKKKKKKT